MFPRRLIAPYITEGIRTAAIMGAGDMLAQTAVEKKQFKDIDYKRTTKFAMVGLVFVGPVLKYWFGFLDRTVTGKPGIKRAVKKMLADQIIVAPALNLSITGLVALINNEKPQQISERIKTQYPDIMKKNYMIWPVVQTINFAYVPLQYQVVFEQVVAVFWNCFLSDILNEKLES